MLTLSDVRHQLLAHLRHHDGKMEVHHVQGARIRHGVLRHLDFEHSESAQSDQEEEEDEELRRLAPLCLSYTDNAEVVHHTWDHLYQLAYVRADTMHFWILNGFKFAPRAFLMLPSLGGQDASPKEITRALSRCGKGNDGRGTPVTLRDKDPSAPPRAARLTPEWRGELEIRVDHDTDSDTDADTSPPPRKRLRAADVARGLNTDRMASPALVREIHRIRREDHAAGGGGESVPES